MRGLCWTYEAEPATASVRRNSARWALVLGLLCLGCRASAEDEAQLESRTSSEAPRDPKRFTAELASWTQRWAAYAAPPSCAALLPSAEQASCASAQTALHEMKKASSAAGSGEVLERAATLALRAHQATLHLRRAGLGELLARPTASDASTSPSAVASGARVPSTAASGAGGAATRRRTGSRGHGGGTTLHEHEHSLGERQHDNPHLAAINAYSRLAALALRQMAVFLEHGPLPVRAAATGKLERLASEEDEWEALRVLAAEGALLERDPELKKRLLELKKRPKRR